MITVLYAEDDPDNAFMLSQRLHRHGIEVRHVEDGEQALQWMAGHVADAVLLDINLPRIDGLSVLRRLRADRATRTLPVIVVSASVLQDATGQAMAAGADAFVAKPVDFARLLDILFRLIPGAGARGNQP